MKYKTFSPIIKILLLLALFVLIIPKTQNNIDQVLAKTAVDNPIYGPDQLTKLSTVSPNQPDCEGLWINSDVTEKILLNAINLRDWGAKSSPSLILDTPNPSKNYLIIGHNICYNGVCDQARSQFSNIMKLNVGDKVSACIGNKLYTGYIFTSAPIPDTSTYVMGDWTGFNTVTMFTSYGNCKDSKCSSTNQRWMVAFERE